MIPLSHDTDPRIEKIQIELLRKMPPERKFQVVSQMNHTVRSLMMAGLKEHNPALSAEALRNMLAELLLGKELAGRVLAYHAPKR
ncbi:MAG: hypothetical protein IH588_01455 [Anaerolineales bacterium]|nr:hypothetical protein [Anaerolineales bacterium]